MKKAPLTVTARPAGPDHQVLSMSGVQLAQNYQKQPCPNCPWRKDSVGEFPAEAFRLSASTCHDASHAVFACHTSGREHPKACAGFLLKNSAHNLRVRLARIHGQDFADVTDAGLDLFENYREMAVANGVDPEDPALAACRP